MSRSHIFPPMVASVAAILTFSVATPAVSQNRILDEIPGLRGGMPTIQRSVMPSNSRIGVMTSVDQAFQDPLAGDAPDFSMEGDDLGNHTASRNLDMNGHDVWTAGGDILVGGGRVLGIAKTPSMETEAASKFYVDSLVGEASIPYEAGSGLALTSETFSLLDIASGSGNVGAVRYNGTNKAAGRLYGGSVNPSSTTRMNYDGALYATEFFSNQYFYFSDESLKENVERLGGPEGMRLIEEIRPVRYNLKDTGREALGVIAQETAEVLPNLVNTNEAGLMSVDYIQLISPMIAAIQDLNARVAELEAQRD